MTTFFEEKRPSDSPFIDEIWYAQSTQPSTFTSLAESHSELVVGNLDGTITVTVRGPETKATPAMIPAHGEWLGIVFKLGTFVPTLLPKHLIDRRDVDLLVTSRTSFWLDSTRWEIPTYENADAFIERLVRQKLLVFDPVVGEVLAGHPPHLSPRALQYRFVRATGLPYKVIQQIERAQQASVLLQQGSTIADTTYELGYYDQSHLTNALRRFLGQTPAQIAHMRQPE
ncbi:MAG: helix-turn-helix domain-containing protein [Chloroflexota bacterium]